MRERRRLIGRIHAADWPNAANSTKSLHIPLIGAFVFDSLRLDG